MPRSFQDALLMGTAAGFVVLNSAATALAAAASDSDEDYSAFEPRWVGRERARECESLEKVHRLTCSTTFTYTRLTLRLQV